MRSGPLPIALKLTIGNKNKEKCTNKKKEYFEMSFFVLYFHVQSYEPGKRWLSWNRPTIYTI